MTATKDIAVSAVIERVTWDLVDGDTWALDAIVRRNAQAVAAWYGMSADVLGHEVYGEIARILDLYPSELDDADHAFLADGLCMALGLCRDHGYGPECPECEEEKS